MKLKIFLVASLVLLGMVYLVTRPDGKVRVIFCDVGQGDGVLVTSGSFQMLIDTGPENMKMTECLGKHVPFWDKKIEVVVLSHLDADHSGGLKQIRKYYQINEQNIYSNNIGKNDSIAYGTIVLDIISPGEDWGNDNDNSRVGLLRVGESKFLLMGDVTAEVEQKLVWRGELGQGSGEVVLKVSHHGSAEATSEELLEAMKPSEAVISVGKNNKFGHPTKVVLERLESKKVKIRRTDAEGDIIYVL